MAKAATADESSDSRELILRAALTAFSEKGFEGATTRDIATHAGVNHGLIPYYFGDKVKLWRAAVDRAFAEMEGALDTIVHDESVGDDRERTRRLLRSFVYFVARNPEFIRLMHEEGKRRGPRMRWLVDRHVKPMYERVRTLLERSQANGQLPGNISPLHFHYMLVGAVSFIFHQAEECKRLSGVDPFDPETVEDHARAVEYAFLGLQSEENP